MYLYLFSLGLDNVQKKVRKLDLSDQTQTSIQHNDFTHTHQHRGGPKARQGEWVMISTSREVSMYVLMYLARTRYPQYLQLLFFNQYTLSTYHVTGVSRTSFFTNTVSNTKISVPWNAINNLFWPNGNILEAKITLS